MPKFVFRIDDVHPRMNWGNFEKLMRLFNEYGVIPLLGVIPNNKDEKLKKDEEKKDFWELISQMAVKDEVEIAMHGYEHLYTQENAGLLSITQIKKQSEFAGLSLDEQCKKIVIGKEFLLSQGIATDTFMAPGHSFDRNTLKALNHNGFNKITDGIGVLPYESDNILFVPQQMATPRYLPLFGVYTICIHSDYMEDGDFSKIEKFISRHSNLIIPFSKVKTDTLFINKILNEIIKILMIVMYKIKRG